MFQFSGRQTANGETDCRLEVGSRRMLIWNSIHFALPSFLLTETIRYLLTFDFGWHGERWLAEGVSSLIVGYVAARLLDHAHQRHQATIARLRAISEMNRQIRAALGAIRSPVVVHNQQSFRIIFERVEHIERTVQEIVPYEKPFLDGENAYAS